MCVLSSPNVALRDSIHAVDQTSSCPSFKGRWANSASPRSTSAASLRRPSGLLIDAGFGGGGFGRLAIRCAIGLTRIVPNYSVFKGAIIRSNPLAFLGRHQKNVEHGHDSTAPPFPAPS